MSLPSAFQLVCIHCNALGIVFDGDAEGASSSTIIRCRDCHAVRGTLGDLRSLVLTERRKKLTAKVMKQTVLAPLDLIDARRRLVAMRSSYSEDQQITNLINRLLGRIAHLNEPKNKRHEDHLRQIITQTMDTAEHIALQKGSRTSDSTSR